MRTSLGLTLLTLSLGGLVACDGDDAPTPSEIRARIAQDVPHILGESQSASESTSASLPAIPPQIDLALRVAALRYPQLAPVVNRSAHLAPEDPIEEEGFDPDEAAAWLNDNIFTDANHVGGGVFAVPAALACTTETVDDTGVVTEALDPECVTEFNKVQLRIRVEQNDETLKFAVQVDANHDEPLAFTLRHDAVGVTLDLDDADAALTTLAPVFGETAPNVDLAGQISGLLEVPGTAHLKASLTIDRDVAIAFAGDGLALDSDGAFRFASKAAAVFAIDLDGSVKAGSAALGLGATTAHIPGTDDPDFPEPSTDLDLPGATATASFTDGQPLSITNIGLGNRTTTVAIDGQQAIAIDLNPDAGRSLSASIAYDAVAGTSTIAVTPKLDLRYVTDYAALGDPAPRYDVTQVLLDGANPTIGTSDTTSVLRVISGHFALVTNPAEYGVSADAGQCVSSSEVVDAVTGEYYEQWSAGACQ